jgi:signal transduction histidine kinase
MNYAPTHAASLPGFFLPAAVKPRFGEILSLLSGVLDHERFAREDFRSHEQPVASLGEAFADVPNDLGFPSTAEFRVIVCGEQRNLKSGVQDEIYRIGREAIVNAFRHSGARKIEAEIDYRLTELRIAVRDDGCGINPQQLESGRMTRWGLQGMRERAERIGARLRLLSKRAMGTEVELSVPFSSAQPM